MSPRIGNYIAISLFGLGLGLTYSGAMTPSDFAVLTVALLACVVALRQLDIAKQQGDIVLQQLSKRADLTMRVELARGSADPTLMSAEIVVYVENIGTRRADGFTWQLGVESRLSLGTSVFTPQQPTEIPKQMVNVGGRYYDLFRDRAFSDLYKGRVVEVARVRLRSAIPLTGEMTFVFQVVWDEGEFPGNGYRAQVIEFVAEPTSRDDTK